MLIIVQSETLYIHYLFSIVRMWSIFLREEKYQLGLKITVYNLWGLIERFMRVTGKLSLVLNTMMPRLNYGFIEIVEYYTSLVIQPFVMHQEILLTTICISEISTVSKMAHAPRYPIGNFFKHSKCNVRQSFIIV